MRPTALQPTSSTSMLDDEHALHVRVAAEFREMPGLCLTLPQAARLFSLEPRECARVLGALVERGVLTTDGCAFARPGFGRQWA